MEPRSQNPAAGRESRLSFGPGEWSGAFGDVGTDLPLLAGLILVCGLEPARVLLWYGLCQIVSGLAYRLPMPVQPLKVVAALAIAAKASGAEIQGAGLAVGLIMFAGTLLGGLEALARLVPVPVVRGLQCGLGIKLGVLALGEYVWAQGPPGVGLALAAGALLLLLLRFRRVPASVALLAGGAAYAAWHGLPAAGAAAPLASLLPPVPPAAADLWAGLVLLALPQIPLSLGNSVLATQEMAADWFPARAVTVRKIGWTYSLLNLACALFGGVPVCHGSGGLAGHYAFGGRTGGSVVLYGGFFLALAALSLLWGGNPFLWFPLPVLGIALAREALALVGRVRGLSRTAGLAALGLGLLAAFPPYGFLAVMGAGVAWSALGRLRGMGVAEATK